MSEGVSEWVSEWPTHEYDTRPINGQCNKWFNVSLQYTVWRLIFGELTKHSSVLAL